jgi:hypothetical protein
MRIDMLVCFKLLDNEGVPAPVLAVGVSERRLGTTLPEVSLQISGKWVCRQSDDPLWSAARIGKGCRSCNFRHKSLEHGERSIWLTA